MKQKLRTKNIIKKYAGSTRNRLGREDVTKEIQDYANSVIDNNIKEIEQKIKQYNTKIAEKKDNVREMIQKFNASFERGDQNSINRMMNEFDKKNKPQRKDLNKNKRKITDQKWPKGNFNLGPEETEQLYQSPEKYSNKQNNKDMDSSSKKLQQLFLQKRDLVIEGKTITPEKRSLSSYHSNTTKSWGKNITSNNNITNNKEDTGPKVNRAGSEAYSKYL